MANTTNPTNSTKKKTILSPVKAVATAIGIRKAPEKRERVVRPKLLVSIVNSGSGRKVKGIINELSVGLSISFKGYGTAYSALLDYLGIGQTEKTIVLSVIPETDEERIMKALRAQMSLYLAGKGISSSCGDLPKSRGRDFGSVGQQGSGGNQGHDTRGQKI